MAQSGMQMMLRSLGINPDEIKKNVEDFMVTMKAAVDKVEANQVRIEVKLEQIITQGAVIDQKITMIAQDPLTFKDSSRAIYEDGKHTGVILTDEKFPNAIYRTGEENHG